MKVVVRAPNWVGDQIMAYPFFVQLRKRASHITVLARPWVQSLQYRHLVDEVLSPDAHINADWAITLTPSLSSAFALYRMGIKKRTGWAKDGAWLFLNDIHRYDNACHRSELYVRLLDAPLIDEPFVQWGAACIEPPKRPYFVIAPGSRALSRTWPEAKFLAVAEKLAMHYQMPGLIIGMPFREPQGMLSSVVSQEPAALACILKHAAFFLGNDSGLAHMAALLGTERLILVWGAGDLRQTVPRVRSGQQIVIVQPRIVPDCFPCVRQTCRFHDYACLEQSEQDVFQAIKSAIC